MSRNPLTSNNTRHLPKGPNMKRSRNRRAGRAGDSDAGWMLVVEWFDDCAQHLSRTRSADINDRCACRASGRPRSRGSDRRRAMGEGRPRLDARHVESGQQRICRAYNPIRTSRNPRRTPRRCISLTRKAIATRSPPSARRMSRAPELIDWSGDGSHALFGGEVPRTREGRLDRSAHRRADDAPGRRLSPLHAS